ncbi:MAG: VTT domain-containing protein [Bacillota bacterium]
MQKSKRYLIQLFAVILFAYLIWQYGPEFYRVYSNRNLLNSYLQQAGVWAPAVFVLLTAAQVIAAPIPAMALGVAGGFIFGLLPGFLLSLLGLFIGSMLAFGLAKWFGQPLVRRLIGDGDLRQV